VQLAQSGVSQVPLRLLFTFQSQSRLDLAPHVQRVRRGPEEQMKARPPPGMLTISQGIRRST